MHMVSVLHVRAIDAYALLAARKGCSAVFFLQSTLVKIPLRYFDHLQLNLNLHFECSSLIGFLTHQETHEKCVSIWSMHDFVIQIVIFQNWVAFRFAHVGWLAIFVMFRMEACRQSADCNVH